MLKGHPDVSLVTGPSLGLRMGNWILIRGRMWGWAESIWMAAEEAAQAAIPGIVSL